MEFILSSNATHDLQVVFSKFLSEKSENLCYKNVRNLKTNKKLLVLHNNISLILKRINKSTPLKTSVLLFSYVLFLNETKVTTFLAWLKAWKQNKRLTKRLRKLFCMKNFRNYQQQLINTCMVNTCTGRLRYIGVGSPP